MMSKISSTNKISPDCEHNSLANRMLQISQTLINMIRSRTWKVHWFCFPLPPTASPSILSLLSHFLMRKANINVLFYIIHSCRFPLISTLPHYWVTRDSVKCGVHVLQVVRISHRELWEGNFRSQHRSLLVMMEINIVSLAGLGRILVAHGDVLCVVVPMFLERRHSANTIIVSLHISGRKVLLSAAGTSIVVIPHDLPERR